MYDYFDINDNKLAGTYSQLRPFMKFEKYAKNLNTLAITNNDDYDPIEYSKYMLSKCRIRKARDGALLLSDLFLLDDHVSDLGLPYTALEMTDVKTFRQELRDWPATIVANNFDALHTPLIPSCIPVAYQTRLQEYLNLASI